MEPLHTDRPPAPAPRSAAQRQASRRNGAKSKGPTSAEGKRKSSRNSRVHGFSSDDCATAANADPTGWNAMHQAVLSAVVPTDSIEEEIARQMAHAQYNLHRLGAIEIGTLDLEIFRRLSDGEDQVPANLTSHQLQALAFETLAGKSNLLNLLDRYQARHFRHYHRALKALHQHPKLRRTNLVTHLTWIDPDNRMTTFDRTNPSPGSEDAPLQPLDSELGGVGDRHDGHYPGLDGICDD